MSKHFYYLMKLKVEKVQRYVETMDILKVKNTTGNKGNGKHVPKPPRPTKQPQTHGHTNGHGGAAANHQQSKRSVGKLQAVAAEGQPQEVLSKKSSGGVVVTTQWETFDSLPTVFPAPQTSTSTSSETIQHTFNWDLLLK